MENDNKDLQRDEFILPGNLGFINDRPITKAVKTKDSVTLTIGPEHHYNPQTKFIALTNGGLMDADEWTNTPLEKIEDAKFTVVGARPKKCLLIKSFRQRITGTLYKLTPEGSYEHNSGVMAPTVYSYDEAMANPNLEINSVKLLINQDGTTQTD